MENNLDKHVSCDSSGHVTKLPFDNWERQQDAAEMFCVSLFGSEKVNSIFIRHAWINSDNSSSDLQLKISTNRSLISSFTARL